MILICRFRRPLASAQTNRFALRFARDSAQRGQILRARRSFYAYIRDFRSSLLIDITRNGPTSSDRATVLGDPRAAANRGATHSKHETAAISCRFVCLVEPQKCILLLGCSFEIHVADRDTGLGWLGDSHRQAGCPPAPQPRWLCSSRFRCGAAAPAIAKAAGRATGRQES